MTAIFQLYDKNEKVRKALVDKGLGDTTIVQRGIKKANMLNE